MENSTTHNGSSRTQDRPLSDTDTAETLRQNRAELQDIADSDLPAAWIAATLLDIADADPRGETRR